jgi:hypothetical protein
MGDGTRFQLMFCGSAGGVGLDTPLRGYSTSMQGGAVGLLDRQGRVHADRVAAAGRVSRSAAHNLS